MSRSKSETNSDPVSQQPRPPPLGRVPVPPPPLGVTTPPLGLTPIPPPPRVAPPPPLPSFTSRPAPEHEHSPSPSPPPSAQTTVKPTSIGKPINSKNFGIKLSLSKPPIVSSKPKPAPKPISSVFNADSSDDEEEIPAEARYDLIITDPNIAGISVFRLLNHG